MDQPPAPYVGITGIASMADVDILRSCARALYTRTSSHRLMAGVLISRKTLTNDVTTNRRYPIIEEANEILAAAKEAVAWPVVHFNTQSRGSLLGAELEILAGVCPAMEGLQLNVVAPDVTSVCEFCRAHPGIEVILQVNTASLRATGLSPQAYVNGYPGVRHAIYDMSGGAGKPLDPYTAKVLRESFWALLRERGVRMGVAGGLGPSLGTLPLILSECVPAGIRAHDLSYDAESGVRVPVPDPIEDEPYQDMLDRTKALGYVGIISGVI